ncbi:hypothetical protein [Nocardia bovistercoris]|uniref:Uncharacterized protein n=1 Tax=Nocardia bovistercoris TaxID=2785916 RepID=A0A931I990_9NOCA|nr:hypothetical protein [Nocardia bovistercoris]MBH0776666.1 hypothetical protein [Nocardia bovistercoris]
MARNMGQGTVLKSLLREQHLQSHSEFKRAYDRVAAVSEPELVGTAPSKAMFYKWLSGDLQGLPRGHSCRVLEAMFPEHKAEELFEPAGAALGQGGEFDPFAGAEDIGGPRREAAGSVERKWLAAHPDKAERIQARRDADAIYLAYSRELDAAMAAREVECPQNNGQVRASEGIDIERAVQEPARVPAATEAGDQGWWGADQDRSGPESRMRELMSWVPSSESRSALGDHWYSNALAVVRDEGLER